jgi:hypothetical protein
MPIDMVPVSPRTQVLTLVLAIGLPVALTAAAMLISRGDGLLKWSLIIGLLAAPVGLGLLWNMSRNEVRVAGDSLEIRAGFYSHRVRLRELKPEEAILLPGDRQGAHQPRWRQNGIGLPGYRAGWFKLRNGATAFLLMTGSEGIAVPAQDGTWVFLSPERPAEFLEMLSRPHG